MTVSPLLREWATGLLWFSVGGLAASGIVARFADLWPPIWFTVPLLLLASACCVLLALVDDAVRNPDDGRDDG